MRRPLRVTRSLPLLAVGLLGVAEAFPQSGAQPPPPLPVTRIEDRLAPVDLDTPRTVSLTIAQPLPLVTGTPFSIVTSENVDGSFSGELKDLSMRQAIEAVLFPRGLDYSIDGTVIRVHAQRAAMRLFDVSYLNVRRDWQRGVRSTVGVGGEPPAAEMSSAVSGNFFDEIEKGVNALLSPAGRAHVDRHNGVVQVTDVSERLDRVALYLETVHLRAVRQVRLEARVFEVTLSDPAALSIDWQTVASRSGESWIAGRGAAAGVRVADFTNVLKALGEQGSVRMLAAPQVVAMNNEPAVMRMGTQDVFFTTTTAAAVGGGAERISTPVALVEGFTMTVVPQIAADGVVHLSVSPTLTERTGESRSRQGDRVPVMSISEADTLVRVRDGEAVVISGLLQDRTKTKQGEGLAGFFGSQTKETVRSELVILIKATVVTAAAAAAGEGR